MADEIAMIDIEPNELIERMKVGKIYKTNRIQVALSNFFKYDNLVSLREITMREMTDKLEKQKNNGIKPTKFLVLISPSPSSAKNIRVAARMGLTNHSKFQALYVETHSELSDESAKQLKKHMELVKSLGGEMIVKYADDVVSCIADYVRIGGVTNLIIGKTWQSIGKKMSFENKIIAHLPDIEVLIVPDKEQIKLPKKTFKERVLQFSRHRYIEKFKMANKALDFIRYLTIEIDVNNYKCSLEMISMLLSRTFKRSTIIKINDKAYISYTNIEDQTLFETNIEKTAMSGVLINRTPAGRGTTLYEMQMVFISLLFTKIN